MYALVDCNNFYVSCERAFNPKLEGKPVIVLSNNDGCAVARSEEAKALGIKMATPAFMITELIKKHDVRLFSSNYTLYADMSDRVMRTLAEFVPELEVYSIDEAFLNFKDLVYSDLFALGFEIRKAVKHRIGIPVTVGIAQTKTLAKMCNKYAKKHAKDIGVHWAANKELIKEVLKDTEVEEIWGIGRQHALLCRRNGFTTAFELSKAPDEWIRKNMSVVGRRLLSELNGIPAIEWKLETKPKKNICTSRSFGSLTISKKLIKEALCNYAASCAAKLRQEKSCATKINVLIQTNQHRVEDEQYMRSITISIPVATNLTPEIIKHACRAFELIFQPGYKYHKCGVIVMDLVPQQQVQLNLFEEAIKDKENKIAKAMDSLNKNMGKETIRMAIQGYEKKYKLRADHLSQHYTTDINQILKIKI
jgi:DNA polymerase V